mgnify:CR=1 FL=1
MGAFGFGSVRFQGNETKLNRNQTVYLKQKPNQVVYELSVFKPNHLKSNRLGKSWNQTEPFNIKNKPKHLSQTN